MPLCDPRLARRLTILFRSLIAIGFLSQQDKDDIFHNNNLAFLPAFKDKL